MQTTNSGFVGIFMLQLLFLLLFVLFVRYDSGLLPLDENATANELDSIELQHKANYPRKFCVFCAQKIGRCKEADAKLKHIICSKVNENCMKQTHKE